MNGTGSCSHYHHTNRLLFFLLLSAWCCAVCGQLISIDDNIQARAVGAADITITGSHFAPHMSVTLYADIPISNVRLSQETCVAERCQVRITFDPLSSLLLGSTISAVLTSHNGSTPQTEIATVVDPPILYSTTKQHISTYTPSITIVGSGLGQNCTDVSFQPRYVTGEVRESLNDSALEITVTPLDNSFVGVFLNVSVSCNGVWSNYATAGEVDYAPVDTTSAILCSGNFDSEEGVMPVDGPETIDCVIYINGNGKPVWGSDANFLISLDDSSLGEISHRVPMSNCTLKFTYTAPHVRAETTAALMVLEAISRRNITNSPIVFQISPRVRRRFWQHPGIIAVTLSLAGLAVTVAAIVVLVRKMRTRHHYEPIAEY